MSHFVTENRVLSAKVSQLRQDYSGYNLAVGGQRLAVQPADILF
jgi:hypothetical protein